GAEVGDDAGGHDSHEDDEEQIEPVLPRQIAAQHQHRLFGSGEAGVTEEHDHEDRRVAEVLEEMAEIEHDGAEDSMAALTGRRGGWTTERMRILVVDDDRKVAGFIRKRVEEEGHAVEVAGDGAEAIERVADGSPWDLVVLDVMLPKRDGFSVLKTLREDGLSAPVLMLTARDAVGDRVTGL